MYSEIDPGESGQTVPLHGQTFYLDRPINAERVWDLFLPRTSEIEAAVFFIHGGGWRGGARNIFHPIIDVLLDHGIACASTDYRLAEVIIAEQIADVREVYANFLRWLFQRGHAIKPIVFGSSAGAHLALILGLAQVGACGELLAADPILQPFIAMPPAGIAVVSAPLTMEPWRDIVPAIWNDIRRIVGGDYERDPERYRRVSPIAHVNDHAPPILLMQAENEDMFPQALTDVFMQKMRNCGRQMHCIEYANAEHGFFYDVTRRCQQDALRDLLRFIKGSLGSELE